MGCKDGSIFVWERGGYICIEIVVDVERLDSWVLFVKYGVDCVVVGSWYGVWLKLDNIVFWDYINCGGNIIE